MFKQIRNLVAGASLLLTLPAAQASLLTDEVRLQFIAVGLGTVFDGTAIVSDPGVEFSVPASNPILVDVHADSFDILIDLTGFGSVGLPLTAIISDLDWVPNPGIVTGLTLSSGNVADVISTSFTDDSVTVNLANLTNPPVNHNFTFDIETSHAVPEPSAFALFGLSALAMTGWNRRKQKS